MMQGIQVVIFLFDFRAVNGVPGDDSPAEKISFVYIPSHLYHIMFELVDLIFEKVFRCLYSLSKLKFV